MAKHRVGAKRPDKGAVKKSEAREPAAHGEGEDCRCKEMSKKTPRELFKVAIDDLSFWKKKK